MLGSDVVVTTGLVIQELLQGFAGAKAQAQIIKRVHCIALPAVRSARPYRCRDAAQHLPPRRSSGRYGRRVACAALPPSRTHAADHRSRFPAHRQALAASRVVGQTADEALKINPPNSPATATPAAASTAPPIATPARPRCASAPAPVAHRASSLRLRKTRASHDRRSSSDQV